MKMISAAYGLCCAYAILSISKAPDLGKFMVALPLVQAITVEGSLTQCEPLLCITCGLHTSERPLPAILSFHFDPVGLDFSLEFD